MIFPTPWRALPAAVRVALELRGLWLDRLTVEAFRHWLDALDSLSHDEASLYSRCVS